MGSGNFSSTVDLLKGYNVNLYVGEEIIKGKLMGVESDHIILEDENKYVYYYSIDKIQAITKNTKQFKGEEITAEFVKTQSLADLLNSLKNSWVSILCLNKQSFSGVLSIVDEDFVTLINGEDRILIKISHISNILKGYRKEEKEEKQEEMKNESEAVVSDSKSEENDDNYVETQVFVKSDKVEKNQPLVVNNVENDAVVSPKVVVNQSESELKVWAEPIKTSSKSSKINNENKAPKVEKIQTTHVENNQQNVNLKQSGLNEGKWTKTEIPQSSQENVKKQKAEVVVQNIVKHDKESIQKPTGSSSTAEKKAQVKQLIQDKIKTVPTLKKEAAPNSTQELVNRVNKVKESIDTTPIVKVEKSKRNNVESQKVDKKTKAQEVGASRFSGEPAMREFDRRSIFSGWPNRNNSQRRI